MKYDKIKKGIVSLGLAGSFLLGAGAVDSAFAQGRRQDWRQERREERWEDRLERRAERLERARERRELNRIRQLDRHRQLRFRNWGFNRLVGYYDRRGDFHPVGYYDRFGRFWLFR